MNRRNENRSITFINSDYHHEAHIFAGSKIERHQTEGDFREMYPVNIIGIYTFEINTLLITSQYIRSFMQS